MDVLVFRSEVSPSYLDTFYTSPIVLGTVVFPTAEHAFQYYKYYWGSPDNLAYAELIRSQDTPAKARYLGGMINGKKEMLNALISEYKAKGVSPHPSWDEYVKILTMRRIIYHKFLNSLLNQQLTNLAGKMLIYHTRRDTFWGTVLSQLHQYEGHNYLGRILMETRGFLTGNKAPPTDGSNWVIEDSLLAAESPEKYPNLINYYLEAGITFYISLQEPGEHGEPLHYNSYLKDREGPIIQTTLYGLACEQMVLHGKTIYYISLPIPDRGVTEDRLVDNLALSLVAILNNSSKTLGIPFTPKVLIHCRGGKGRTGTLVSIILAKIYALNATDAMKLAHKTFQSRPRKGRAARMPQTKKQIDQVRRIVDV